MLTVCAGEEELVGGEYEMDAESATLARRETSSLQTIANVRVLENNELMIIRRLIPFESVVALKYTENWDPRQDA